MKALLFGIAFALTGCTVGTNGTAVGVDLRPDGGMDVAIEGAMIGDDASGEDAADAAPFEDVVSHVIGAEPMPEAAAPEASVEAAAPEAGPPDAGDAGCPTQGAVQCSGQQPQVCSSGGVWMDYGTACPGTCLDGACVSTGSCTTGQMRCLGQQPQSCVINFWQNNGSVCTTVCLNGACQ